MRLLIAMVKHETNTFSPVPTPLALFQRLYGEAAIRAYHGTVTRLAPRGRRVITSDLLGAPP
jgi:microcystin degradation protein MlrC